MNCMCDIWGRTLSRVRSSAAGDGGRGRLREVSMCVAPAADADFAGRK